MEEDNVQEEELEVKDFRINGERNDRKLKSVQSKEMANHIIENIQPQRYAKNDVPW